MNETILGIEEAILEATLEDIAAMPPDTKTEELVPLRFQAALAANAIHHQAMDRIVSAREAGRVITPQPIPRSMRVPKAVSQDVVVSHRIDYIRHNVEVVFDDRDDTVCHLQPM